MEELRCKLLILGAGPGGYVCAIRAGQLGIDTVLVESENHGGTCLNVGCIPSKAMIHAAEKFHELTSAAVGGDPLGLSATAAAIDFSKTQTWKNGVVTRLTKGVTGLLKKAGVRTLLGRAQFLDGKGVEVTVDGTTTRVRAEHMVIATGARPTELSMLPFDGPVISSTEALALDQVPGRLVVIGAGYIGLELGMAYAKLGSHVTVVEAADQILPAYHKDLVAPVAKRMQALGIETRLSCKAQGLTADGAGLTVEDASGTAEIQADKILVAVGRTPISREAGLERLALDYDGDFIRIDDTCLTSMRGVYAIGDVTGEPMLAHRAMAQGEMVAEIIGSHTRVWDRYCIPAVCFTDPEIVTAGLSETEAKAQGHEIKTGRFPLLANGQSLAHGREDGFVRVIARADNGLILGLEAVGQNISELSSAFALAIENALRLEDVAGTIHAHPTRGEAVHEAMLDALGHTLHI
ncbi:MAG: dihydrolipoyl dehydrogenase [Pseudomonadota bacterium]